MGMVPVDRQIRGVIRWNDQLGGVMHALAGFMVIFSVCGMIISAAVATSGMGDEDVWWPVFLLCSALGAFGLLGLLLS